jgi:hypothetical protein
MRTLLARALSLLVAAGVVLLLVVHAGATGCAAREPARPDPWLNAHVVPGAPVPTAPIPSAAAATAPPVAPDPVIYLPASKAGPVFYPANPAAKTTPEPQAQPAPQQQAAP